MFDFKHYYLPPDEQLWQGRTDSLENERFFQMIDIMDLNRHELDEEQKRNVLIGFCCDEGVKRNNGRVGAKLGPNAIRHALAKLPCHTDSRLIDIGNITCDDGNLENAQLALTDLVDSCHAKNKNTIVFGGGHEVAWGHFQGLARNHEKMGIINFDAHFDLRPLIDGQYGSSGNGFTQIANYCHSNEVDFEYCCLGIQSIANTKSLYETAEELRVSYITAEEMNEHSFAWQTAFLDSFMLRLDHIYLTICMDVFAECFAPGVSAPQATGLTPWQTLPLLKYIMQSGKVIGIDIAELAPPLDQGQKTARLAANIVARLLY